MKLVKSEYIAPDKPIFKFFWGQKDLLSRAGCSGCGILGLTRLNRCNPEEVSLSQRERRTATAPY